jgi:hypothetical protein
MVTQVKGKLPVQLFDILSPGQKLQIPAGSEVVLSFLEGGGRYRCAGPATLQMDKRGPKALQGQVVAISGPKNPQVAVAGNFNWDRMAAVKRDDLQWLIDPCLRQGEVELTWSAPDDLTEVEIVVEKLPDFERVFKGVCPAKGPLPLKLQPGCQYALQLRGFSPRRTVEAAEHKLSVLSTKEATQLQEWEKSARAQKEPAALVELCSWLLQAGLRSQARSLAQELLALYPEQSRLQQLVDRK